MESTFAFSAADNSIDIVGAIVYLYAAYLSAKFLYLNNINIQGKIIYVFICVLALLHTYQAITQLIFGTPLDHTFRVWDTINYITAFLFMMIAQRLHTRERYNT